MKRETFSRWKRINREANNRLASIITYVQDDPESLQEHFSYRRSVQSTRTGLKQDRKNIAQDFHNAIKQYHEEIAS